MTEIQTNPYLGEIERIIMAESRTLDEQEELDSWLVGCTDDEWKWYLGFSKQRHLAMTKRRPADFVRAAKPKVGCKIVKV